MRSISTHVLDTARGLPAEGVLVTLERLDGDAWTVVRQATTDGDGRVRDLVPEGALVRGTYRATFALSAYFHALGVESFYPRAQVEFVASDDGAHYHVPLLLSPFGYSTYRGS